MLTARTEVTDRMLIFGERHLHDPGPVRDPLQRTAPPSQPPTPPARPDHPVADLSRKRIQRYPVLGGLINEYERAA